MKKIFTNTLIILAISFTMALLGCNDQLDININPQVAKISLYSQLNPAKPVIVSFYKSKNITDTTDFDIIDDAVITLYDGINLLDTLELTTDLQSSQPYWKSNIFPHPGVNYTLKANAENLEEVTADAFIPDYVSRPVIFYKTSELLPISLGGNYKIIELTSTIHLPDFPNNATLYSLNIYIEKGNLELNGGELVIKSYSHASPIIFSPVSVSDFVSFSMDKSIIIRKDYWENNRDIDFRIRYTYNFLNEKPLKVFYEWRTLSEDYYDYHYALSRQNINDPFSEPVTIHNNINNGYGNFSGFNFHKDSLLFLE
jgi:hypothetical protein